MVRQSAPYLCRPRLLEGTYVIDWKRFLILGILTATWLLLLRAFLQTHWIGGWHV